MGARGGSHPTGLSQRSLTTLFLRCPHSDFSALIQGTKREYRMPSSGARLHQIEQVVPTPVVLYCTSPTQGKVRRGLAVLTATARERLSDIAYKPASLAAEGFETYDQFRRYWRARTRRGYRPMAEVDVYEIARWGSVGQAELGDVLLRHLYGDYL